MRCRICIVRIQPRTHVLDHAELIRLLPGNVSWIAQIRNPSALKDLDDQVGIDQTDRTDHLSELCNVHRIQGGWSARSMRNVSAQMCTPYRKIHCSQINLLLADTFFVAVSANPTVVRQFDLSRRSPRKHPSVKCEESQGKQQRNQKTGGKKKTMHVLPIRM